jgi:hypothetical protein
MAGGRCSKQQELRNRRRKERRALQAEMNLQAGYWTEGYTGSSLYLYSESARFVFQFEHQVPSQNSPWFSSVPPGEIRESTSIRPPSFRSCSFRIRHSYVTDHSAIRGRVSNRSQMHITQKKNPWYSKLRKKLFLDISSTNADTFVQSLYQCV